MIRRYPFPYEHVISFDSDVDRQEPWHGVAIHRYLNGQLGLAISNSCWVTAARARQSSFFIGADLNNRLVPEEENRPTWRLLLREWHRGNIDHFHSWYDDGTYLLRYLQTGDGVTLPGLAPASVGSAVYRVLRLVLRDGHEPADINRIIVETEGRVEYRITEANHGSRLIGNEQRPAKTIELILGLDKPLAGTAPANWTLAKRVQLPVEVVEAVELDNISRRLLEMQAAEMERLNVRPVYVSSHGGRTCAQNFGEPQIETKGRFDAHDDNIVRDRIPQADQPLSHAYYQDLLVNLGTQIIWPQMWARFREFSHDMTGTAPVLKPWSDGVAAGWRTHIVASLHDLLDVVSFSDAMSKHVPGTSANEIAELYKEFHDNAGLGGKRVVTGHGSAIPFLLYASMSMAKNGSTAEHLWYTHFGSHRDGRDAEISPDNPFTKSCSDYWARLAAHVHGIGVPAGQRAWAPAVGTYFRYKLAVETLREAVSVDGSEVRITSTIADATRRILPDPIAGTRDLHGMTIYVASSIEAKVHLDDHELRCFSRNPPDITGRESVTILDNHCPTIVLDRIPLRDLALRSSVEGGRLDDLAGPTAGASGAFVLRAEGERASLKFWPRHLSFWNPSHLAMSLATDAEDDGFAVVFTMNSGARIGAVKNLDPGAHKLDAYWELNGAQASEEYWLPHQVLKFVAKPDIDRPLPLPHGRVMSIEIDLRSSGSNGSRLWIDWIRMYRANPDGVPADQTAVVGGRVFRADQPLAKATVEASSVDGSRVWSATTDRYGEWLVTNVECGTLLDITCNEGGNVVYPTQGRYLDVQRNEVEIDIVV